MAQISYLIQLSDTHIREGGRNAYRVSDTKRSLQSFTQAIKKLWFPTDLIVVTGDLSDDGSKSSYRIIQQELKALEIPYLLVPGNHDDKKNMASVFTDHSYLNEYHGGRLYHSRLWNGIRLILLDSVEPGDHNGSLPVEVIRHLESELDRTPTILFMHHPPFPSGIGFMDRRAFENSEPFIDLLKKHPEVILLGCGHFHRSLSAAPGGIHTAVSPSAAMQLDLNLNDDAPGDFIMETPGFLAHKIVMNGPGHPELFSHTVQIPPEEGFSGPHPFTG